MITVNLQVPVYMNYDGKIVRVRQLKFPQGHDFIIRDGTVYVDANTSQSKLYYYLPIKETPEEFKALLEQDGCL